MAAARLHVGYIERDGVEKDGSRGQIYSSSAETDLEMLRTELPGERHQFRFIVSPEDGHRVDLTEFARDLMKQVERDTGHQLLWGAVNHHDTDNPHVHIVVRGVSKAGKEVRFGRAYISEHIRWQAQHLVTKELGRRTELDVTRQLGREVRQERFTTLDRQLGQLLTPQRTIDIRRLMLTMDGAARARLTGRLRVLETLALARRTSSMAWELAESWEKSLRALGERGDIIKRIHRGLGETGNVAAYSILDGQLEHPPIEGIVRRKGLHDELRGDMYAVIETERGRAHYVRIDAAQAEALREGALVRITTRPQPWAKKTDRVLAQVAAEGDGIYDPARHAAQLTSRPLEIANAGVEAKEVMAANLRRLTRLERYQLVSRLPDGRWAVPPDLMERLAERERSHPKVRTKVEVIASGLGAFLKYPGPTWLDRRRANDPIRAPFGFGAEISGAVKARQAFLESIGIKGDRLAVDSGLRFREQASLGAHLAARTQCAYVPELPATFRGKLFACEPTASGARFARIVDDTTGTFILVPADRATARLEGKSVELAQGANGGPEVRMTSLGRGGR